jgi:uncharacterized protein (TIGR02246 family)
LGASTGWAQQPRERADDEAALFKNAEAFVEAFHKGDAKALAAFWTADGDYTDQTGHKRKGRAAIEKAFKAFFAEHKGLKLRVDVEALTFVSPDVAIEDGVTSVIPADGAPPSRARYTIVHVKKDGQWQLRSVRDAAYAAPSNHEHLRGLEWAVGDWAEENDKGEVVRMSISWAPSQNFLLNRFTKTFKDVAIGGGIQWIGWDPVGKHIRSWTFEEGGDFGEGTWSHKGNRWLIKSKAVLRDGKQMTATHVLMRQGDDSITWQATERTVDGKALPDAPVIKLQRAK